MFGLSSVSIFAQGVDDGQSYFNDNPVDMFITDDTGVVPYSSNIGYTVRPYWRPYGESEWYSFSDLISTGSYFEEIEIYYEIHLTSTIKKNSTFDFKMVINSDGFGSVRVSRLSVYDSNWNRAVSDFPTVEINGNVVECLDIWNNKRDVGILGLTFVITDPEFMQVVQPEPEPEPDPSPSLYSFKINNTYFDYEPGMTFSQWVNSDYNTVGFVLDGLSLNCDGNTLYYRNSSKNTISAVLNYHKVGNIESGYDSYYCGDGSILSLNEYEYNFTLSSLTVTVLEQAEVSGGILGWVKNIFNNIVNLPSNIANKISGFFSELGNKITALGDKILDGIKSLFVPSEDDLIGMKEDFDELLSSRFGVLYDSAAIVDNFADSFYNSPAMMDMADVIEVPVVTVNLAGADFSFGGFAVDIVPEQFEGVIYILRTIVSIVCTLMFVNALRKRLEGVLH